MSILVIIRGNSGSGKTTAAKKLQEKFGNNTMLISQDIVRRDILKVKDGIDTQALPLMKELLLYGKNNCDFVILEGIMNADWYKSLFEVALAEFGDDIFAYYYDLPFEETLLRHQSKPNRNEFGEEAMRRWWRDKDFIESIPENIILENQDLEGVVESIYMTIMNQSSSR